jgi:hypothetical protein
MGGINTTDTVNTDETTSSSMMTTVALVVVDVASIVIAFLGGVFLIGCIVLIAFFVFRVKFAFFSSRPTNLRPK